MAKRSKRRPSRRSNPTTAAPGDRFGGGFRVWGREGLGGSGKQDKAAVGCEETPARSQARRAPRHRRTGPRSGDLSPQAPSSGRKRGLATIKCPEDLLDRQPPLRRWRGYANYPIRAPSRPSLPPTPTRVSPFRSLTTISPRRAEPQSSPPPDQTSETIPQTPILRSPHLQPLRAFPGVGGRGFFSVMKKLTERSAAAARHRRTPG